VRFCDFCKACSGPLRRELARLAGENVKLQEPLAPERSHPSGDALVNAADAPRFSPADSPAGHQWFIGESEFHTTLLEVVEHP
jgi:hypothetical protein